MDTKRIVTTVPLTADVLKEVITKKESVELVIDVKASALSPALVLTYLTNLSVEVDLEFADEEVYLEYLRAYLTSTMIHTFPQLECAALELLCQIKGIVPSTGIDYAPLIEDPSMRETITKWLSLIESLTIFMACSGDDGDPIENYPVNDTQDLIGINFVKLIGHELFPLVMLNSDPTRLAYYPYFYEKSIYQGSTLSNYWMVSSNVVFMMDLAEHEGLITDQEFDRHYNADVDQLGM